MQQSYGVKPYPIYLYFQPSEHTPTNVTLQLHHVRQIAHQLLSNTPFSAVHLHSSMQMEVAHPKPQFPTNTRAHTHTHVHAHIPHTELQAHNQQL